MKTLNIVCEGNIGAGKTTFNNNFVSLSTIPVTRFCEPVEQWQSYGPQKENYLANFYNDPKVWSYRFQECVRTTMASVHANKVSTPIKLMERSLYSARYCFTELLYEEGYLTNLEYKKLCYDYEESMHLDANRIDLIIYLKTDPETAYSRIFQRARSEETSVSIEYLMRLHEKHENWLLHGESSKRPCPVLTLDANGPHEYKKAITWLETIFACRTNYDPTTHNIPINFL